MARNRVQVKLDVRALRALRQRAPEILKALDRPVAGTVRATMGQAQASVPVETGELRGSSFVDGPKYNLASPLSTSWTGGYAHPQAGPIHEGFHWGQQQTPEPHWLRKAFAANRRNARKGVATTLKRWLARNLSHT
jgi:hypothetical protein